MCVRPMHFYHEILKSVTGMPFSRNFQHCFLLVHVLYIDVCVSKAFLTKGPNFTQYLPENGQILRDTCSNVPKFFMTLLKKILFLDFFFWGGGGGTCLLSLLPVSHVKHFLHEILKSVRGIPFSLNLQH